MTSLARPTTLRLPLLALSLTLLLGTAACNRDKKDDLTDEATELQTTSTDHATAENDDAVASENIDADLPADLMQAITTASPAAARQSNAGPCATRTWDPATRTLTIDFGATNCLCADGRQRRGQLIAVFNGSRLTPGSTVVVTRQNYFVNDNQHLGTLTRTYNGTTGNDWSVQVRNAGVIFANGGGQTVWQCDRRVVRSTDANNFSTITVTGQATGTNRRGVTYTATVVEGHPLFKRRESGCADVFIDGWVSIVRTNGRTALLNYNPGGATPAPCDRRATITVGERVKEISLR